MNRSRIAAACAATLALGLAGCATVPGGKHDPRDPFERVNRGIYRFNTAADHAVLRPAARAWKAVVPAPVRRGLARFLARLGSAAYRQPQHHLDQRPGE